MRNTQHPHIIKTFAHKGLHLLFETGSTRGIQARHAQKLRMQLAALDTAFAIGDLDLPGYQLHLLQGKRKDTWAISVNGNWRLTFEFIAGDVYSLNYEDYH